MQRFSGVDLSFQGCLLHKKGWRESGINATTDLPNRPLLSYLGLFVQREAPGTPLPMALEIKLH